MGYRTVFTLYQQVVFITGRDSRSKNLFLTAPLVSLQSPFQRRSASSLKFQNQKDDNEESDVSCEFVSLRSEPQNVPRRGLFTLLFNYNLTTWREECCIKRSLREEFRIRIYKTFCLQHGNVYYRLFLFHWTDSLTRIFSFLSVSFHYYNITY